VPWRKVGPRVRLSEDELNALPTGRVRTFDCGGVLVPMWKRDDGHWQVTQRRVPSYVLADLRSVERVRVPICGDRESPRQP
jgi:hypothetical protein